MPVLENPRHELFAEELATGKSASEAYALAGFKPSRKNASRLRAKEDIGRRVQELQAVSARSTAITIESVCAELDQANQVAKAKGQAAAMVSASALRAKLGGLMVEKVEIGPAGAFDEAETPEEVTDALIKGYGIEGYQFTDDEHAQLTEMLTSSLSAVHEFLMSCKARPVKAIEGNSPADIRWREFQASRPEREPRRLSWSNRQE